MRTDTHMAPVAVVWVTLVALTIVGCGGREHTETPVSPTYVATLAEAQQQATRDDKRVVAVFYVDWSEPAELFFAESIPHRDVRRFYDRYVWVQMDVAQDKTTSQQFRIYVSPSIVILEPSGQEVARYEKFLYGPELADFLSQHVRH